MDIIYADASTQDCITDEQKQFFLDNGFLVIRNVVGAQELPVIQAEMSKLLDKGAAGVKGDPDFMYGKGEKTGTNVLRRIEYVIDKSDPMKVLLGHPFILRSVEKIQGVNFIPTWDSMVIKMPNEGIVVPWHRDGKQYGPEVPNIPVFNVDFYLDSADLTSCLWVIPGSNLWPADQASARCKRPGFDTSDAIPVPMNPGDVIFHDITLVHGSPAGDGNALRRTVYYEFRAAEIESAHGPHSPEYIPLKQQVLLDCIQRRAQADYTQHETPFQYSPTAEFNPGAAAAPSTYRYAHANYRRKGAVEA
jgi:ectoine hydroxylase-related dioxygenase (phytanoyl-CoA dioxygenase family)